MLNVVVGFVCDFPGCGETVTRRRASAEPRLMEDDLEPPEGWLLLQTVGKDEAQVYCAGHPLRLEGTEALLKRRVGFELLPSATREKKPDGQEAP